MPYISQAARVDLEFHNNRGPGSAGELNYLVTGLVTDYIAEKYGGRLSYSAVNEVVGVLECAKMELYRRIAVPYEDKKMEENGDVYPKEWV